MGSYTVALPDGCFHAVISSWPYNPGELIYKEFAIDEFCVGSEYATFDYIFDVYMQPYDTPSQVSGYIYKYTETAGNQPLQDARIYFNVDVFNSDSEGDGNNDLTHYVIYSDINGYYELNVPNGAYEMWAYNSGYPDSDHIYFDLINSSNNQDFTLYLPSSTISGLIYDAATAETLDEVTITIYNVEDDGNLSEIASTADVTTSEGYQLELPNGCFQARYQKDGYADLSRDFCVLAENYVFDAYLIVEESLGDVNDDGYINIADLVQIINVIVGNTEFSDAQMAIADINQDTYVNIEDVVPLVNIILGYTEDMLGRSKPVTELEIGFSPSSIRINLNGGVGAMEIHTEGEYELTSIKLPEDWEFYHGPSGMVFVNMKGINVESSIRVDLDGDIDISSHLAVDVFGNKIATSISAIPDIYQLHNAYPNPFNPVTKITYDLPEDSFVNLIVYDIMGRQVTTLVNEIKSTGYHQVIWNASEYASGMYFIQIISGNFETGENDSFIKTQKLMLVK